MHGPLNVKFEVLSAVLSKSNVLVTLSGYFPTFISTVTASFSGSSSGLDPELLLLED